MSVGERKVRNPSVVAILAICCLILLVSCARNAERDAICSRAARWNAASTAVSEIISIIPITSPGRLQDVFTEVVATLTTLNDVAPTTIKPSIEQLLETYDTLATALRDLNWQGGLLEKDALATSAAVRLSSSELELAQTNLGDYISMECNLLINNVINRLPDVGTTLPDPIIQDETKELPNSGFDNDASMLRAFGFVVAERFGVAITDQQAACVGTALVDLATSSNDQLDATYLEILQKTFDQCLVKIDVAASLEK